MVSKKKFRVKIKIINNSNKIKMMTNLLKNKKISKHYHRVKENPKRLIIVNKMKTPNKMKILKMNLTDNKSS